MNYRELGRTGLMVSEIGLGCEGFVDHDGELVEPLLNAAEQAGVNCLDLYSPDPEMRSRLGRALTACQCIHYALTRPAVAAVMTGAHTVAELEQSLAYETAGEDERDYAAAFSSFPRISWNGHCMYCGHCAPCPKGIDVAAVTKFLNLARAQNGVPETVREHYAVLPHKANECVACGACTRRCPFGVDVVANMNEAAQLFGRP